MENDSLDILLATMVRPHQGGIKNHLNNLIWGWRLAGHTVHLYTPFGRFESFLEKKKTITAISSLIRKTPVSTVVFYLMAKRLLCIRVFWALLTHRYNVVNVRDVGAYNACFLLCKLFRIPAVLNLHGCLTTDLFSKHMIRNKGKIHRYFLNEEKKSYRNCKYIVAVGPQEKNGVLSFFPEKKKDIPIIYNLVDVEKFHPDAKEGQQIIRKLELQDNGFNVFYVGRLSPRKGIDILIKAFSKFSKKNNNNTYLVIIGAGPECEHLKKLVIDNEISNSAVFTGLVKHEELNGYYNAADVIVIPSLSYRGYTEGTPTVALESMACGVPVIATPLGGLADIIINEQNGLIIEENSIDSLCQALGKLHQNSELMYNLSISAREYVLNNRSREKISSCWIGIFRTAITGGKLDASLGV